VADLLLLDLADMCDRLEDASLPVNRLVSILRRIDHEAPEPDTLLSIALMHATKLPAFYKLDASRADAETRLSDPTFWDWIEWIVDSGDARPRAFLKPVVENLKKRDLDGRRGRRVLVKIGEPGVEITESEFWSAIREIPKNPPGS
jgi:hypothetical protein